MFKHIRTLMKVLPETMVYTDEYIVYSSLNGKGYKHERVTHAEKVLHGRNVHTNTIEGFWSLLKYGIGGVYHSISAKHLQDYVNEYTFRYSYRDDTGAVFDSVAGRVKNVRDGKHAKYSPVGEYGTHNSARRR